MRGFKKAPTQGTIDRNNLRVKRAQKREEELQRMEDFIRRSKDKSVPEKVLEDFDTKVLKARRQGRSYHPEQTQS